MKQLIIGNWKMNLVSTSVVDLIEHLHVDATSPEVIICPPFPYLSLAKKTLRSPLIQLGAQDCHKAVSGAYTGDVSGAMLADLGCKYVILGHSERRQGHKETSAMVRQKAIAALVQGLKVIICIGETDGENQAGLTESILKAQLHESIPPGAVAEDLVIAYEPVWAIGTGRTATDDEIIAAHLFIRSQLEELDPTYKHVRILYGGSVNAKNASVIRALKNVDGVLVGGASLNADDFNTIIQASE
jgi:triosephosphate isomerase